MYQRHNIIDGINIPQLLSVSGVPIFFVAGNFGQSAVAAAPSMATKTEPNTEQKHHISHAIDQLESNSNRSSAEEMALNVLKAILPERLPTQTQLLPNYPNPFNPETWIPFQLSQDAEVSLQIYDSQGRLVRKLELGWQASGYYATAAEAIYWDGPMYQVNQVVQWRLLLPFVGAPEVSRRETSGKSARW